ncbi:hypothetical protein Q0M94_20840 (plasmid) [Deinococcus radiomollis]|uniref:hypothetical protein n=1 Tax=Deinococcus radiomollis TaxID=468916 RepID=UPI003892389A
MNGPSWSTVINPPDAPTQIAALLNNNADVLLDRAYGRTWTAATINQAPLSDAACQAVFTVTFQEVVTAALTSGWYTTVLCTGPVGGDGSLALIQDQEMFSVVFLERDFKQVLYTSAELRSALEAYLIRRRWASWLAGTDGLLAQRTLPGVTEPLYAY